MRYLFLIIVSAFFVLCSNSPTSINANRSGIQINDQPSHHVFVDYLQPTTMSINAVGEGDLTYQWAETYDPWAGFTDIPGATGKDYTKVFDRTDNYKIYVCKISDANSATESQWINIIVDKMPPIVTVNPESCDLPVGETLFLYAEGSGTDPIGYVWKKNGIEISDATSSGYFLENVQLGDAGEYTCDVVNDFGLVTTNIATVTVH